MANSRLPVEADQPAVTPDERITYLSLHAVNIFVRDQDRSLRFYLDQLGFNLAFDARLQSGSRWVAVSPPDGSAVLSLIAPRPDSREYKLIGRATQVVFVTEDVIAQFHQWRQRGVQFSHTPRLRRVRYERHRGEQRDSEAPVWGGVFTRFRDIDGNTFGLIGLDAVTREIEQRRRIHAERLEAERRAARELEIAKQVQARLFPQNLPPLRTLEYAGACIQARQVGGDYYDFLTLSQDRLGLVIGDTSGKGMPAALLMANLQANFRSQCATASEAPQQFLRSVNELFYQNTTESAYATLFFAEYDDRLRRLRYANCGHLAALLVRNDNTLDRLESTGTVLGLFPEWDCSLGECSLACGDVLALYTDGVTECCNDAEEEFGEQRLIDALLRNRFLPPRTAVASIVEELRQFGSKEQYDDITLVLARCTA